jgi:hypothetical protein
MGASTISSPCFLILALLLTSLAQGEDQPTAHAFFDETFKDKSNAWSSQSAQIAEHQLVLSCSSDGMYDGVQIVFTPTLNLPPAGHGCLRLRFVLAGVESPNGGYSARFFLLPTRIPADLFIDSYGAEHGLTLEISGDDKSATLSLSTKNSPGPGYGKPLYSGSFTPKAYPLPIEILLDQTSFRLTCGAEVKSSTGSRSGRHNLADAKWQGDVSSAIRLVTLTKGNKPKLRLTEAKAVFEPSTQITLAVTGAATRATGPISATVQVQPLVMRSIGGYDQVQPLFGGNVNGASKGKADALLRDLNLNTSRLHMWPDTYGAPKEMRSPTSPSFAAQFGTNGGYMMPLPASEIEAAWDKWFQLDFNAFLVPCISQGASNPNGGSMESQLALQKAWGCLNNIVFLTTNKMDASAVRNSAGACRYFDQYLDAVEKHAPWINATFAQLTNEPNYGWYTGSFAAGADPVASWIRLFNIMDEHLRKTHPKTRLLGPCLASSAFFSWEDWQRWTMPILKGVDQDMDYFNYHNYDTPAVSHLAWVEMLQAQAEALGRRRPRAVITEMNDDWTCDKAARKFEWWAEQLFYGLENPDKYHLFSYFLAVNPSPTPQLGNLVSLTGDTPAATDTYWLFWTLRQTRGSMRYVEPVGVTDLKVFACAPQDDRLVISILNNTGRPTQLKIRSGLPQEAHIKSLERWSAHRQADLVLHEDDTLDPTADVDANLPVGAVQSFVWNLAEPDLKMMQKVEQQEFFAKVVSQKFTQSFTTAIDVPRLPREDETVTLRFAVSTDDLLAAHGLTMEVGGHVQSAVWTEAPREEERGPRAIWWMELPIPSAKISKTTPIIFSHADTDYRLMFASLTYLQHPTSGKAK